MNAFEITRQTRRNVLAVIDSLDFDQLIEIPKGLNNNILWNLGHVLVTQQALIYRLSGNQMKVEEKLIELFKKGAVPIAYDKEILSIIKDQFLLLNDKAEEDYKAGLFDTFTEYPTSYGYTLHSIEEAIEFNAAHEALHLGYIMALRRMVLA